MPLFADKDLKWWTTDQVIRLATAHPVEQWEACMQRMLSMQKDGAWPASGHGARPPSDMAYVHAMGSAPGLLGQGMKLNAEVRHA